jgi:hypothetical protein
MLSGTPVSGPVDTDALLDRFLSGSARQRRGLLRTLEQRLPELIPQLQQRIESLDPGTDDWAGGCLVQLFLSAADARQADRFLECHPQGWLAVQSQAGIDHGPLQRHLMRQEFEAADRLTSDCLRQLAGPDAVRRGYVYYSEVAAMPAVDLDSLDRLWVAYSRGRFGFSVQGRLLRSCRGQWEQLWPRLGWKRDGVWTRYPRAFTWSLEAPEGHMPLINQLRGVRLMDALLHHPAVVRRIQAGETGGG